MQWKCVWMGAVVVVVEKLKFRVSANGKKFPDGLKLDTLQVERPHLRWLYVLLLYRKHAQIYQNKNLINL